MDGIRFRNMDLYGYSPHDSIGEEPVANAGSDLSASPGDLVTLDGTLSYDGNGSIIAYEWVQVSGTGVLLNNAESAVTSFTAPNEPGVLVFSLTVFDNDINQNTDQVTVNIIGSTSIYDIQYTEEQGGYCYETLSSGQTVSTTGVVTHVKPGDYPNFFIQDTENDMWSGIYVYDTSVMPQVGDELVLSGTINEYYSFTQIVDISLSETVSSGNIIEPTPLSASNLTTDCSESSEMYESMLVKLTDITLQSVNEFGTWTATDGSGSTFLLDDYYFDGTDVDTNGYPSFPSTFQVGSTFENVVGVFTYSYNEFKVSPRNILDFNYEGVSDCVADGDVNGDGGTNILDVVQLVNYILGDSDFTEDQICSADLNGDGGLNVLDVVQIVNQILGN